jgi:hypothetical protein
MGTTAAQAHSTEDEAPEGNAFSLKLRTRQGDFTCRVRPNTEFSRVADAFFASHPDADRGRTRFTFDGDPVALDAVLEDIGIDDDGLVIDVHGYGC